MVAPLIMGALNLIAPMLFKALSSPIVAGTAASFIAGKFGLGEGTVEAVVNFLNGMKPNDQIRLKEIDIEFKKFIIEQDNKIFLAELGLIQGQLEINKIEAAHQSVFVAGWRPYVGWVCGSGLLYAALVEPVLRFACTVIFDYKGAYPEIDKAMLLQVLIGLLGMASLRTYEKKNGVAS